MKVYLGLKVYQPDLSSLNSKQEKEIKDEIGANDAILMNRLIGRNEMMSKPGDCDELMSARRQRRREDHAKAQKKCEHTTAQKKLSATAQQRSIVLDGANMKLSAQQHDEA
jgi:hypothetical protein